MSSTALRRPTRTLASRLRRNLAALIQPFRQRTDYRNRAYRDAWILGIGTAIVYAIMYHYDVHDTLHAWLDAHEDYEVDEFLNALMLCGIAGFIYALRRLSDLRQEIRERRRIEAEAHRLARHDALTGLPNRRSFLEQFHTWAENLPPGTNCAMMVLDLDHFKPVNDLYGHRLGDEVLRTVAKRLRRIIADQGMVARLGGDEFGIIVRFQGADAAIRLAYRIVHEIPRPIPVAALSLEVGASLGVALYHTDDELDGEISDHEGGAVATLLRRADMAMYRAKADGRGAYRFFDKDMDERLRRRLQLEREIKAAIASGQIVPYYQPLVDLSSQKTCGYEVLARWEHPTRGLLFPETFIPIAEDTGTIGRLTYALLERAIEDAKHWPDETYIALNLSPRQFADSFLAQKFRSILAAHAFPPRRLEIEITETAIVKRLDEARANLNELRDMGIHIALDDFGTGYAGLYHLRALHLDTLKIDRSFVAQILDNPEECKIVEAMIRLGRALGLETIAEGVESKEVMDRLMQLGCQRGQGYFFGKPMPAGAVVANPAPTRKSEPNKSEPQSDTKSKPMPIEQETRRIA